MELVYLWVKKYKNIKEQGFNFSPKFNCHYDGEILTIKDNVDVNGKKQYIDNFFGDNINVTAIVGKNGSGKSSVLKSITWYSILVKIDNKMYSLGFSNGFKELSIDFNESVIYINSDLILPSEFNPIVCDAVYPTNNNLYNLIADNNIFTHSFNSDKFYKNLKNLIIEYANIVNSNIFLYNPSYTKLYIKKDEKKSWQTIIREKLLIEKIDKNIILTFLEFLEKNQNIQIKINDFKKFSKKYKQCLNLIDNIDVTIYDKLDRSYFELSQGERIIYTDFLIIYDAIIKRKSGYIFLILDEPDLTLHPNWQKIYISELLKVLKQTNKKIHLIITSHSPFLLSDIPKQNIIFLDTYQKEDKKVKNGKQKIGNCKVLFHDEVLLKKQTFGANIHTLLSDSFFMKDGLMGEFAKNKIEDVVKFLQEDNKTTIKSHEEAKQIISVVGEPILKMRLEKMLDDYKIKKNIETEEDIEKQIEVLKLKLQKKKQNG